MHLELDSAESLVRALSKRIVPDQEVEVGIAPPFPFLHPVRQILPKHISVGAQNLFWEPKGAFTGEVSGPMLRSLGAEFVIVGHSERRKFFGETDETVNKRVRAALEAGLKPVVCVGETLEQREAGQAKQVVGRQLEKGLAGVSGPVDIAYEPVWAIGTGVNAKPDQVEEMHAFIVETVGETRVLYGGSVKPENAGQLANTPNVGGFLVGGASLDPDKFASIISEAKP